jgi:hypothetical protein
VPYELRNSLAGTFADQAAEHGPAELITETARKWGTDGLADLADPTETPLLPVPRRARRLVFSEA